MYYLYNSLAPQTRSVEPELTFQAPVPAIQRATTPQP